MGPDLSRYWSLRTRELLSLLKTTEEGLSHNEARHRHKVYGHNLIKPRMRHPRLRLLLSQFTNPVVLILLFSAVLAIYLQDAQNAAIIMGIVALSGLLGFWQEFRANSALEKLLSVVKVRTEVLRDGESKRILLEDVVPGDVVVLSAGNVVPADCVILESKDLYADEAALTGEAITVEKEAGEVSSKAHLNQRRNCLYMGTHVISGKAKAAVVRTGRDTEFGEISSRLDTQHVETEFERGIRGFGYMLMEVMLVIVIAIFAINLFFGRTFIDSLLFSLAIAVGLTPQLLPAITSITLAYGAQDMAKRKVIVKRLASLENFGGMNVLCADKTGTLTDGTVRVHDALDTDGKRSERVMLYAYLNAAHQSGFVNPIDAAIRQHRHASASEYHKLDEAPYDFSRRRLSVLVARQKEKVMITKGSVHSVLEICNRAEGPNGPVAIEKMRKDILQRAERLYTQGYRVLGVAYRKENRSKIDIADECCMTFLGFLVLFDPPKEGIIDVIRRLEGLGVSLKIITGDNWRVASHLSKQTGVKDPQVLTGEDLRKLSDERLVKRVNDIDIFAEVEPAQKERIIRLLKSAGNVVGYLGDGINDAPALHAADIGISVDGAVDVAKDASDIVLLKKDLDVLTQGVRDGRRTFANTLKYVFMATSANFGNMFSLAGASLLMPFLPLLPKQILLMNLLTDLPQMTIATDEVDAEWVNKPQRWNIGFVRRFMGIFGLLSSVFDYMTFGAFLFLLHSSPEQFRTAWFIESILSASMIVLLIRTRRPLWHSRPSKYLAAATLAVALAAIGLTYTGLAAPLGLVALPFNLLLIIFGIVLLYLISGELAKSFFYSTVERSARSR